MNTKQFKRSLVAITIAAGLGAVSTASVAGNVDGGIKGVVTSQANQQALAGATVTITNVKKGYSKTVTVDANGQFNLSRIPVGKYQVSVSKAGYQTTQMNDIIIGIGKTAMIEAPLTLGNIETIAVTGGRITAIDFGASESSFNITAEELEVLPIARNLNAVALLAPGTVEGDDRFDGLVSFGGASVGENSYYVNGLNMTNFRNGRGGAAIPFTAYESFQVKTGGYSAEFGRTTGGVISGVTKSGNNDFTFGAELVTTPDSLRETGYSPLYQQNDCKNKAITGADGKPAIDTTCSHLVGDMITNNEDTERGNLEVNLSAGGAIIDDTLFFYGVYRHRDFTTDWVNASRSQQTKRKDDDAYYLGRIDWNINEDHTLMAWTFSDERAYTEIKYDSVDGTAGYTKERGTVEKTRGGKSHALRYTGNFTDDFSMSAMYGSVEFNDTDASPFDTTCPVVYDGDTGVSSGCWVNFTAATNNDTRTQFRLDFEWFVNDEHTLRFGADIEANEAVAQSNRSGGVYYRFQTFDAGATLSNKHTMAETARTARVQVYNVGGTFKINNSALYIEDQWNVNDNLRLNLGLRSDSFENLNADEEVFISIDNQLAPRLGLSWDVTGEGDHKVFANLGRYFLPIAANTNVRLAGAETYTNDFYLVDGVNSDDTPILGTKLGEQQVTGDGTAKSAETLVDRDIKPMFNDEFMLGYQGRIDDDWSWGAKFTHRILGNQIDDGSVETGFASRGVDTDHFILFNPGRPATFNFDVEGDGVAEQYTFSAEELGYPEASRTYNAVDLTVERSWDDVWMFSAQYTWSKNYGNAEGYLKSDNGQDDAGLTTDWDYPSLMDGAYGNLPNDRRHVIKIFGAYTVADNLTVGLNSIIASGRPWTALGNGYTPDQDLYHYGKTYWVGDQKFSRGSMGRTPWTIKFDVNASYKIPVGDSQVIARVDIFNLFNAENATRYDENAETAIGQSSPTFGTGVEFQTARRIQFSLDYRF
jgi:hypothetical protein